MTTANYSTLTTTTTLFIGNINGRIKKQPLKRLLHALCTPYGQVLDIVVMRQPEHLRGTAFVVFKDASSVKSAMNSLESIPFMGRSLRMAPAHSKSNARREFELYCLGLDAAPQTIPDSQASVQRIISPEQHNSDGDDMDVE